VQLWLPVRPVVAAGTVEVEGGCGAQLREARSQGDVLGVEDLVDRAQLARRFSGPAWPLPTEMKSGVVIPVP
jgi:hypothetical protein